MATIHWRGDAPAKAQVQDYQFGGTWEATDVVNFTINGKTLSVVAGSTTIAAVVSAVVSAFNDLDADAYPEFAEITASVSTTGSEYLRLTAVTAGKPFTITVATTETGGSAADAQTISSATVVQASRGPEHADDPVNYSGGALPANGDTLVVSDTSNSIRYGLTALSAVTLDVLAIHQSFTGDIGLPMYDADGRYYQYRDTYLAVGATLVQIGAGEGQGSGRIKLNLGSVQSTVNVTNTGSAREQAFRSVILKGTHADNELNVLKGSVDVAPVQGETSTFKTVRSSYLTSMDSDSNVRLGAGVTLTDIEINGGFVEVNSDTDSITLHNGILQANQGEHASLTLFGGLFDWRTTGEVGSLSASNAIVDLSRDIRPKAFDSGSSIQLYRGAVLRDPAGVLPAGVSITDNTGGVTLNLRAGKIYEVT